MRKDALLLIKSNGVLSLDLPSVPPAPDQKESDLTEIDHKKVRTELIQLEKSSVVKIDRLTSKFSLEDYNSHISHVKTQNGHGVKITISSPKNGAKEITLLNDSTKNQQALLKYIFDISIQKTRHNKDVLMLYLT